jgi:hypothetical protein
MVLEDGHGHDADMHARIDVLESCDPRRGSRSPGSNRALLASTWAARSRSWSTMARDTVDGRERSADGDE